jgi:hypothetical protein
MKNYLVTDSHVDYRNSGYKVNVNVFIYEKETMAKILAIHDEFCKPHRDQYSYSDSFIKYCGFKKNQTHIECKECKFVNDSIDHIDRYCEVEFS